MTGRGQTWQDFLPPNIPPPEVIGRKALLERCAQSGATISERQLRYLESVGALPRPVRRFHEGAPQALYPVWLPAVVVQVWDRYQGGHKPAMLAEELPDRLTYHALEYLYFTTGVINLTDLPAPFAEEYRQLFEKLARFFAADGNRRVRRIGLVIFVEDKDDPFASILWDPPAEITSVTPVDNAVTDNVASVTPLATPVIDKIS